MRELEIIDWIRTRRLAGAKRGVVRVGPGDDCAVLGDPGRGYELLLKTDGLVDGLHFDAEARPVQVGYKAIARALSDIAACGGQPVSAVVFVALSHKHSGSWTRGFQRGLEKAAERFACPVVGGDVSGTSGPTTIATGLLGKVRKGRALLRGEARAGDRLFVTGRLGGSILGRHLRFTPRLEEGRLLGGFKGVGGCIDISDGLARDLAHILKESGGLGAELCAGSVPIAAAARKLKGDALSHALSDGEDYELLLTLRPDRAEALKKKWRFKTKLTEIGTVLGRNKGTWLVSKDERRRKLKPKGWQHL